MKIIPDRGSLETGNYWCTWFSQSAWLPEPPPGDTVNLGLRMRARLDEELLFGEIGLLTKYFQGVRGDLTVVLDDGWDVPAVDGSIPPRYNADFGSLVLNAERFPSFAVPGNPAESLKRLNDYVKSLGYRGIGLWVATQVPRLDPLVPASPAEAEAHWTERAKWCARADVRYWKVDWGYHCADPDYRAMMSRICGEYAPDLLIEHAVVQMPVTTPEADRASDAVYLKQLALTPKVLAVSDSFRTYDVVDDFKNVTTLFRTAQCFDLRPEKPAAAALRGLLNIEVASYLGAAFGCALSIMYHETQRTKNPGREVDECLRAVRWHRVAPPYSVFRSHFVQSEQRLTDEKVMAQTKWPRLQGLCREEAPAVMARDCALPEVRSVRPDGLVPFVVASKNPGGACSVAALPRTLAAGRENVDIPADVTVFGADPAHPVGVFGRFRTLEIRFDQAVAGRRVYAQDLLDDEAREVTDEVKTTGNTLTLSGEFIERTGLARRTSELDASRPGLALQVV